MPTEVAENKPAIGKCFNASANWLTPNNEISIGSPNSPGPPLKFVAGKGPLIHRAPGPFNKGPRVIRPY